MSITLELSETEARVLRVSLASALAAHLSEQIVTGRIRTCCEVCRRILVKDHGVYKGHAADCIVPTEEKLERRLMAAAEKATLR